MRYWIVKLLVHEIGCNGHSNASASPEMSLVGHKALSRHVDAKSYLTLPLFPAQFQKQVELFVRNRARIRRKVDFLHHVSDAVSGSTMEVDASRLFSLGEHGL